MSAVRETSLLFARVIATLVFRERFGATRVVTTVATVVAMVLVQAA